MESSQVYGRLAKMREKEGKEESKSREGCWREHGRWFLGGTFRASVKTLILGTLPGADVVIDKSCDRRHSMAASSALCWEMGNAMDVLKSLMCLHMFIRSQCFL